MRKEKLADTLCLAFGLVEIVFPSGRRGQGFAEFLKSLDSEVGTICGVAGSRESDAELPELSGLKWTAHACTWHCVTLKDGRNVQALECHGMKKSGKNTYVRGDTKCWGFKWAVL